MKADLLFAIAAVALTLVASRPTPSSAAESEISSLPAGTIRKGSLANQKLIFDASVAASGKLAQMGYTYDPRRHSFQPYVVSNPRGTPGQRHWTERWIFAISGKDIPLTIDFSEDGLGAANYTIRR